MRLKKHIAVTLGWRKRLLLKKAEKETKGFRPWRKITRVNSYVECLVPQQNVRFEFHKLKNIFM